MTDFARRDAVSSSVTLPSWVNHEAVTNWAEDATFYVYNAALRLGWGADAAADVVGSVYLRDTDTARAFAIDLDVDILQSESADFLIRRDGGRRSTFHSREVDDAALRPVLEVTYADGRTVRFDSTRDTALNSTTQQSNGDSDELRTAGDILIAFDDYLPSADVIGARIILNTTDKQYGSQTLTVYTTDVVPDLPDPIEVPTVGEDGLFLSMTGAEVLNGRDNNQYRAEGVVGHAVALPDQPTASNIHTELPESADTLFATEIVRFDESWDISAMGGKAGGLANTHADGLEDTSPNGPGGWGGRGADGDSWSFRLNFGTTSRDPKDTEGDFSLGTYGYFINNGTHNGNVQPGALPVPKGEYVALRHMVKLNTVYENGTALDDGEFALWINDTLVVHQTGIRIRDYAPLKARGVSFEDFLEDSQAHTFWHNNYYGGTGYGADEDHEPHLVSIGHLYVGDAAVDWSVVEAKLAELNALPDPEFWGEAAEWYERNGGDDRNDDDDSDRDGGDDGGGDDDGRGDDGRNDPQPPVADDDGDNDDDDDDDRDRDGGSGDGDQPNVVGTRGDDVLIASDKIEIYDGWSGRDLYAGNSRTFSGDRILGFGRDDALLFTSLANNSLKIAQNGSEAFTFDFGTNQPGLDLQLEESYTRGAFQFANLGDLGIVTRFVDVHSSLREGVSVQDSAINGVANADYLSGDHSDRFSLVFQESAAEFDNILGAYEVTEDGRIVDVRILVDDVAAQAAEGALTLDGVDAGHRLGFFLIQDGGNRVAAEHLKSDDLSIDIVDGVATLVDGTKAVDGATIFVSHDAGLNIDDTNHVLSGLARDGSEGLVIGFEDMTRAGGGSDDDFQDLVFRVETQGPLTAQIDEAGKTSAAVAAERAPVDIVFEDARGVAPDEIATGMLDAMPVSRMDMIGAVPDIL